MILQMVKRKLSLPRSYHSKKVRRNGDIGSAIFGTLQDPIGSVISLISGQTPPSWQTRGNGLRLFDHRKGLLGGLLNGFGMGFLGNMASGILNAATRGSAMPVDLSSDPRLLAYKLTYRNYLKEPRFRNDPRFMHDARFNNRNSGIASFLLGLVKNPTVRQFAKKAALSAAGVLVPKAVEKIVEHVEKKRNVQAQEPAPQTY